MKTINKKLQMALRLIISAVALGLFVAGIYNLSNYVRDHRAPKTPVTARIVKFAHLDSQALRYDFEGRSYTREPVDKYIHDFGKVGETRQVYVVNARPKRIFLEQGSHREAYTAAILFGWGLILGLIVYSERRILKLLNINSEGKSTT